jgi:hypothetical protein
MTGGWAWELPEPEGEDEGDAFQGVEGDPPTPSTSSDDPRALPRAREEPSPSAPSTSSAPSKASKASKASALPAGPRAREEEPELRVVESESRSDVDCHFYADHRSQHERIPGTDRYRCRICSPLEEGAPA